MNFNLSGITGNIVTQLAFLIALIMAFRTIVAYAKQDWGAFWSQLILGLLCFVVVFSGPKLQSLGKWLGEAIFK